MVQTKEEKTTRQWQGSRSAKPDKMYPEVEYWGGQPHHVFKKLWPDGEPEELPLQPSLKLANHSPTGFSWGYSGSGPAQLALALLLDATSEPDKALRYYQEFKQAIVAGWDFNGSWVIFRSDIINWLKLAESRRIRINEN